MTKYLAAALAGLILSLGATPAFADSDAPTEPVPTEPAPVDPTPEPGLDTVDVLQPPTAYRVLPRRCAASTLPTEAKACRLTRYGKHRPMVVVWGDSHSWQQTPALLASARATRTNLVTFQMGACPPMLLRTGNTECAQVGRMAIAFIKRRTQNHRPTTVVVGGAWALYSGIRAGSVDGTPYLAQQAALSRHATPAAFRVLDKLRRVRTIGMAQMPMIPVGACEAAYACDLPRAVAVPNEAATNAWLDQHVDRVVSSVRYLCASTCPATINGVQTHLDALHLNPYLAQAFAPAYRAAFRR